MYIIKVKFIISAFCYISVLPILISVKKAVQKIGMSYKVSHILKLILKKFASQS